MNAAQLAIVVFGAAAISGGLILIILPWLDRYALAHPNARSSHRKATPQGAGAAVIIATFAVTSGALLADSSNVTLGPASLWIVFAAAALIAVVGAIDDFKAIAVLPRLLFQAVAVGAVIASLPADLRLIPNAPWWFERGMLLVAYLWFVNLTNFMDGIDWMTVAQFVPIAIGLTIIGSLGELPAEAVIVALALCGALIGFAPLNRPVARVFLGDVGSLPIGLLFGWIFLLLAGRGHFAAALILPLYYLADATLTLLRRIARREPFWQAHRTHFYQIATDRGLTVMQVVARVFAVNLGLSVLAIASVLSQGPLVAVIAVGGACILVTWLLHSFVRGKP